MRWLSRLLWRHRAEAQLDAELRDHLERQVAEYVTAGMSEPDARRRAAIEFGGLEQVKELCRDARGTRWIEILLQDLRYGARVCTRNPSFTAAAVLSLALGVGANTAIFTLLDATILKPLPVEEPDRLIELLTDRGGPHPGNAFNYQSLQYFRERATTVDVIASHQSTFFVAQGGGQPEIGTGQYVTGDFFRVLGVPAAHGRPIHAADDRAGAPIVVVLSDAYWRDRFGGDPSIVGGTVTIDSQPAHIVGVAPAAFRGLVATQAVDFWLPLSAEPLIRNPSWTSSAGYKWLQLVGRVRAGHAIAAARAEVAALFHAAVVEPEVAERGEAVRPRVQRWRAVVGSARSGLSTVRHEYGEPLFILLAISALVLLIACVNVANLLLARAATRRHEVAVRLSLGASRSRVVRQLLTESILLALSGAAAGVGLAYGLCEGLVRFLATTQQVTLDVRPDERVLAFAALLALMTGLVFGLAPAWRTASVRAPATALQAGNRVPGGRDRRVLSRLLVTSQVALSVMMLMAGGLFLRSLQNIRAIDLGFDSASVLIVTTDASRSGLDAEALRAMYRETVVRLSATAGVRAASVSQVTPIWGGGTEFSVFVQPTGSVERRETRSVYINWVSPGYFAATGTPIYSGRDFTWRDTPSSSKVAIVNRAMARQYFGTDRPLGARIESRDETFEIVAVAGDAKYLDVREAIQPTVYLHWAQQRDEHLLQQNVRGGQFAIRSDLPPRSLETAAREAMRSVLPSMAITKMWTLEDQLNASIVRERLLSLLSGGFAVTGLLLAAIGLYGVMAYSVARRTHEIGIRMALGAQPARIAGMVTREALLLTSGGIAAGIAAAFLLSGTLRALLYGLTPTDAPTALAVAAVMMLAGLSAAYLPSRRATHIDPTVALRTE
ncbi:MAG TPA: ABC transporter permease [Vicinamibacterales bacterium]|nr:ABC transporter permease [Vicinamibacterales bacterium]